MARLRDRDRGARRRAACRELALDAVIVLQCGHAYPGTSPQWMDVVCNPLSPFQCAWKSDDAKLDNGRGIGSRQRGPASRSPEGRKAVGWWAIVRPMGAA
jgi:hypothetical protein